MRTVRTRLASWLGVGLLVALVAGACTSSTSAGDEGDGSTPTDAAQAPSELPADADDPSSSEPTAPPAGSGGVEPERFEPGGPVGSAAAYAALVAELEAMLPAELRDEVPWPDTRNADPVQAQLDIFELWIWMAETHPEPALAQIMAVESSPGRQDIAAVFGELKAADELRIREQAPYEAFDHRVVTLEAAELPLWLSRNAPADSVVVYYQDRSGPVSVRDRSTRELIGVLGEVPPRQWVSIIAPTEVGWLLFRDQLIEPGDPDLEVPDPGPPSDGPERRPPEV